MLNWDLEQFKLDYRTLYKTIIESMNEVKNNYK